MSVGDPVPGNGYGLQRNVWSEIIQASRRFRYEDNFVISSIHARAVHEEIIWVLIIVALCIRIQSPQVTHFRAYAAAWYQVWM